MYGMGRAERGVVVCQVYKNVLTAGKVPKIKS